MKSRISAKVAAVVMTLFALALLATDFLVRRAAEHEYLRNGGSPDGMVASVNRVRVSMLKTVTLAFLPAIAIAIYFAHRTAARLGNIIAFAGELANGNFQTRLTGIETGELGELSSKLNETSAKLERTVQQLQTEHAELEKLERIRKDFVINVSHELRTPLASIQGYTETLMDGALDDQENNMRFLGIIRHNAERLARLTGDLLSLSRIELKTQEFRFAVYRVNQLLAEVLTTILPDSGKKVDRPAAGRRAAGYRSLLRFRSNLSDHEQPARQRGEIHAREGRHHRGRASTARWRWWKSSCATAAWGFRWKTSQDCSNVSIVWIRRAPANWAAPAWAWRS